MINTTNAPCTVLSGIHFQIPVYQITLDSSEIPESKDIDFNNRLQKMAMDKMQCFSPESPIEIGNLDWISEYGPLSMLTMCGQRNPRSRFSYYDSFV